MKFYLWSKIPLKFLAQKIVPHGIVLEKKVTVFKTSVVFKKILGYLKNSLIHQHFTVVKQSGVHVKWLINRKVMGSTIVIEPTFVKCH